MKEDTVSLVLVGLNYQTAPVEYREQFYLGGEAHERALRTLCAQGLAEVTILSTCNRLEIIARAEQPKIALDKIVAFLARSQNTSVEHLDAYLYCLKGQAVVNHVMRVAAGLESLILGETQILGQVSEAWATAQAVGTGGTVLSRLFASALHTGKRARTETTISRHTLSVSHAAVLLVNEHIPDLASARVVVIGAGEMAELAARALQMHGVSMITIINRTFERANELAQELGIQAATWDNLPYVLSNVDVVIAATSAPHPILWLEHVLSVAAGQRTRWYVDLGVPRNIDPKIASLTESKLYDIDDLQTVVAEHHSRRRSEIQQVEAIIAEEQDTFQQWLRTRQIVPLITELRSQAETLADSEVEQALRRMPNLNPHEQEIVMQMAHRIVNKLLHAPTVSLKSRAAHGDHADYAHAVRQLFALRETPDD